MKRKTRKILLIVLIFILGIEVAAGAFLIKRSRDRAGEAEAQKQKKERQEDMPDDEALAEEEPDNIVPDTDGVEKAEDYKQSNEEIIIAIDPGHQSEEVDMSQKEQNAPNSEIMKAQATGGTTGSYTKQKEYQLNLDIALQVRDELEKKGYQVVMTREDNMAAISNRQRAEMANDIGADVSVRIHANGAEDASVQGALCLVMSEKNPNVGEYYDESYRLAENILDSYCEATGFKNQGIQKNDTMTGINWSQVPVMILEMGFMSNRHDDEAMADKEFQKKMVAGIVTGIDDYFQNK